VAQVIVSAEEKEMVARAQRGDLEAWEEIYKKYGPSVYKLIVYMVANISIAEDLTQEVFLRAFKGIMRFRCDSSLATWLRRIAVNKVLDHRREPKPPSCDLSEILEQSSDDGHHAKSIELKQDLPRLAKAICSLPEAEQTVITMHGLYGWSYEELADLRGVAPGTVRKQYHDAILKLRKELAPWPAHR
jgi:RNA polymerase sigma-70 factor, ECF subfamily